MAFTRALPLTAMRDRDTSVLLAMGEAAFLDGTDLKLGDFVWADNERPSLSSSALANHGDGVGAETFPVVDLGLPDEDLVPVLHSAAASWGFFRIFNHGVSQTLLDAVSAHALRFFHLPPSDKLAIARTSDLPLGYTGSARSSAIRSWSEALHVMPGKDRIHDLLERVPSFEQRQSFSTDLNKYFSLMGALADRMIQLLFRGLQVDFDEVKLVFNSMTSSTLRINHYPACPLANLTYGSPPHKDYGGLAILHQDDVGGLEVFKDGQWIAVKPEKGYLIVNIGDIIQVLSNVRYKSMLHRSLVNSSQPRLSFVFFYNPSEDSVIAPISKLLTKESPAKYKSFLWREYQSMFQKAQIGNHSPTCFFEETP